MGVARRPDLRVTPSQGGAHMPGIAHSYDKHSAMGKGKMKKSMPMKGKKPTMKGDYPMKGKKPMKGKVGMGEAGALKSYMRRSY